MKVFNLIFGVQLMVTWCGRGVCKVECWIVMFHNLNCFNCSKLTAIQVDDRVYSLQCLPMIQRM